MTGPQVFSALSLLLSGITAAQAQYLQPPEPLLGVMQTPAMPAPAIDPTGKTLLLIQQAQYPAIDRVAEPYLKLAGVRIEPRLHARHDMSSGYGIRSCLAGFTFLDVQSRKQTPVALPKVACPSSPSWSPDGRLLAFTNTTDSGVELWVANAATAKLKRIDGIKLNTILESTFQWVGKGAELVAKAIPSDLGTMPEKSRVPSGPEIKDGTGAGGETSTYEARDVLAGPEDEALFDYFARSELVKVDAESGKVTHLAANGVISSVNVSPDGNYVLYQELQRPYSYVTTWTRFAHDMKVLNLRSNKSQTIARLDAAENVPVRGVPIGPRSFSWRQNAPATLIYVEALDGGDLRNTVPARDKVMSLSAPFKNEAIEVIRTKERFAGFQWFETGSRALITEFDANRRWYTQSLIDVDNPKTAAKVLWDLSLDERYRHPGSPRSRMLPNGAVVLHEDDGALFLAGNGASPQGDRPFLDRYRLSDGKTTRLFRSDKEGFERLIHLDHDGQTLLTWHESPSSPPNAFVRRIGEAIEAAEGEAQHASHRQAITAFEDPAPIVRDVKKRLVNYTRKDGVPLSFTLYTPPGYVEGTRVPAILYAYPRDFADAEQAGQVTGSEQTFTRLANYRLLLLAGYAIIDNASFPIVGDPRNAYDTYLEQLVANAEAAVEKAVELGVVDRDRIGVTGHSHGALMTANLLAHTDLFRAGVATAGGYNKTLTPFGFQNERRSFWKAPKAYDEASSFFHADKINEPILIMHGADDANPGTEPTQSPRLFQAVRGNGGTARLVMLPFEPHWFTAKESNEHVVAEMLLWFDRYVKNYEKPTLSEN